MLNARRGATQVRRPASSAGRTVELAPHGTYGYRMPEGVREAHLAAAVGWA